MDVIYTGAAGFLSIEMLVQIHLMTTMRKLGRPSKGPRERCTVDLTPSLAEAARAEAKRSGMTFTDWATRIIADHLDMPYPFARQETLPLQEAS